MIRGLSTKSHRDIPCPDLLKMPAGRDAAHMMANSVFPVQGALCLQPLCSIPSEEPVYYLTLSNAFYRHSLIGYVSFYMPNISNVELFLARQLSRVGRAGVIDCFRKPFAFLSSEMLLIPNLLCLVQDEMKQDGCDSEVQRRCCRGHSCKRLFAQARCVAGQQLVASANWLLLLPSSARGQQSAA